jgi:anthranilate/para-aminobenzoate synthase component II
MSCHSITFQTLKESGIADEWRILSVTSYEGTEFISSTEHKVYPFYGVQFHPEKNAFEWKIKSIPHSADAIMVEQFYGNFFVNEGTFTGSHVGSV